jgi:hypothetical protein
MSREFVSKKKQKTSSENLCQKRKKQVQRMCQKSEKQIHMNVFKELKGSKVTANRLYA